MGVFFFFVGLIGLLVVWVKNKHLSAREWGEALKVLFCLVLPCMVGGILMYCGEASESTGLIVTGGFVGFAGIIALFVLSQKWKRELKNQPYQKLNDRLDDKTDEQGHTL